MAYLAARHDAVLASVGGGRKALQLRLRVQRFRGRIDGAQAAKLAQTAGVLAVTKDECAARHRHHAGLPRPDRSRRLLGDQAKGEGIVIGIVDSGIWPEHPSFSDRTGSNGNASKDGKLDYQQIPGWHGKCTPGEEFNATRLQPEADRRAVLQRRLRRQRRHRRQLPVRIQLAARLDGHGTHTASTAGGNANVPATGAAAVFGSISGIAPRARIAAYKVCWGPDGGGGCFSTDSVAAIDQAVADGVDVINFSISGTRRTSVDPVEIAFLFAADAGVFVAASAGNSGPDDSAPSRTRVRGSPRSPRARTTATARAR